MDIRILHLLEGASEARGMTVIIDVFRAFSTAVYVAANGARRIIPIADIDSAYRLKAENPGFLLMGERNGVKQPGFDFGNSPTEVEDVDFSDRTVIQTTSSGTQGFARASLAEELLTGSFVNAAAVVRFIRAFSPDVVSLVCMGYRTLRPCEEDSLCAEYMRSLLLGEQANLDDVEKSLKASEHAQKFFDPSKPWALEHDFTLCTAFDRFDFVLRLKRNPGGLDYLDRQDA